MNHKHATPRPIELDWLIHAPKCSRIARGVLALICSTNCRVYSFWILNVRIVVGKRFLSSVRRGLSLEWALLLNGCWYSWGSFVYTVRFSTCTVCVSIVRVRYRYGKLWVLSPYSRELPAGVGREDVTVKFTTMWQERLWVGCNPKFNVEVYDGYFSCVQTI